MKKQEKIFEELQLKDKKLTRVLDNLKKCPFLTKPKITEEVLFYELAQSIVGQQISVKVADIIWKRLVSHSSNKKDHLTFISISSL